MNVLKELERVMADRLIASGYDNSEFHAVTLGDIRAALAQSAPQPKPRDTHHEYARAVDEAKAMVYGPQPESSDPEPVDIYRDSAPWKPIAAGPAREPPICMGPSARQIAHIQLGELIRLQDRDKWIEEHAKPALEHYNDKYLSNKAGNALAALTPDRR